MKNMESEMWDREYPSEEESEQSAESLYEDDDETEWDDDETVDFDDDDMEELEEFFEKPSIMDSARVRLEQGRLYEMLIKHDLFDGVEALPEAIDKVQTEIKEFITERLEILLGMRAEKETEIHQIVQDNPFNEMEIEVLKRVASKMSKGMTENVESSKPEPAPFNPVKKENKSTGLNTLGTPKQQVKKKAPVSRPVKTSPKSKKKRRLKAEIAGSGTEGMTAEQIAKRDLKYVESLAGMSLEDANEVVRERHDRRPRANKEINDAVVNAHYQNKMNSNQEAGLFTALLQNAKKQNT